MPLSIAADEHSIYINRSLKVKRIPIAEVKSVRLCPPTMGAIRVCGSGGYLGYWGLFKERDLGKYFADYGKASDSFLIELSDGHKYMQSSKNAPEMVEFIAKQLKK